MGERGDFPRRDGILWDSEIIKLTFQRMEFLDYLTDDTADKSDLVETLDVSRSTVDRAIKELEIEDLVEKRSDGYGLTQYGEMALYCRRRFVQDLMSVRRSKESLLALTPSADLDPIFFKGASVLSERDEKENRPGEFLRGLLEDADEFWTVTKSPHFELITLAHRKVVEEGMSFTLIHSVETIDRLQLHYPEILGDTLASGNLELYSLEEPPPFGLIRASRTNGETVVLVLYGQQSEPETLVINETATAINRFNDLFDAYRERASRVEIND